MAGHVSFLGWFPINSLGYIGFCSTLRSICSASSGKEMATTNTATLTFQIDPGPKEVLRIRTAVLKEHRFIANRGQENMRGSGCR